MKLNKFAAATLLCSVFTAIVSAQAAAQPVHVATRYDRPLARPHHVRPAAMKLDRSQDSLGPRRAEPGGGVVVPAPQPAGAFPPPMPGGGFLEQRTFHAGPPDLHPAIVTIGPRSGRHHLPKAR